MATFDWVFDQTFTDPNWKVDGAGVTRRTREVATHRTLTLGFRVTTALLTSTLRPLKANEGKVDVLRTDDGGHSAVDRANGANTFTLDPPERRKPLRQAADYHVARYEESLISEAVDEWQVELELVRSENRTDSETNSEALSGGATFDWVFDQAFGPSVWGFDTANGSISTESVDAEFLGTGADGVKRFELQMRLTSDQAHHWETEFDRLGGVRIQPIPDAANKAVDDTGGDANTMTVSPPTTGSEVPSGEYVVLSWSSTRINEAFQGVTAEIAEAG